MERTDVAVAAGLDAALLLVIVADDGGAYGVPPVLATQQSCGGACTDCVMR